MKGETIPGRRPPWAVWQGDIDRDGIADIKIADDHTDSTGLLF